MPFIDGDLDARLSPTASEDFFVVLTTTPNASAVAPMFSRLTFLEQETVAQDADHDITMKKGGGWGDVETRIIQLVDPMFADGFESGSTSAWSSAVP